MPVTAALLAAFFRPLYGLAHDRTVVSSEVAAIVGGVSGIVGRSAAGGVGRSKIAASAPGRNPRGPRKTGVLTRRSSTKGRRVGLAARRRSLREDMAPKSKRKAKRKRTDNQDARAVAIEGLAAGHEHASDMGVYRHAGREVNGRGVWASVGHHAAYLFYSAMGSWCVSDATDMAAGEHQGSLMVESDAETPHAITESWSVHGTMLTCAPCHSRAVRA